MRKPLFKRNAVHLTLAMILLTCSVAEAAYAQATTSTTQTFLPFTEVIRNTCANGGAGEDVLISGIFHIQQHSTTNGNRISQHAHLQAQGVKGVGLTTGHVYRRITVLRITENLPLPNEAGAEMFTVIDNFLLVGPGPDNDVRARQIRHLTINANGEITSTTSNISILCK